MKPTQVKFAVALGSRTFLLIHHLSVWSIKKCNHFGYLIALLGPLNIMAIVHFQHKLFHVFYLAKLRECTKHVHFGQFVLLRMKA